MQNQSKNVASRLASARREVGLTQASLAQIIGYSQSAVAGIESGKVIPSGRFLRAAAAAVGLSWQWLTTGEGQKYNSPDRAAEVAEKSRYTEQINALTSKMQDLAKMFSQLSADMLKAPPIPREQTSSIDPGEIFSFAFGHLAGDMKRLSVDVKSLAAKEDSSNETLTSDAKAPTNCPVQPIMPTLIERLRRATSERGRKTELAAWLGVPRQSVNDWLSARMEPSGETTLRLLNWVTAEEAKTKKPASVASPAGPTAQTKESNEKKTKSEPPPR